MPSSTDGRSGCFPAGGRSSVGGTDARAWLHDLVTADVEGLSDRRIPALPPPVPHRQDPCGLPRRRRRRLLPAPPGAGPTGTRGHDPVPIRALLRRRGGGPHRPVGGHRRPRRRGRREPWRRRTRPDAVRARRGARPDRGAGRLRREDASGPSRGWPRGSHGGGSGDLAHTSRGRADDGRFRSRRPPCGSGARGNDRLHQRLLPRPGIRRQGPQPRTPSARVAPRPLRCGDPRGDTGPQGRRRRGRGDERRASVNGTDAIARVRWDAASDLLATAAGSLSLRHGQ